MYGKCACNHGKYGNDLNYEASMHECSANIAYILYRRVYVAGIAEHIAHRNHKRKRKYECNKEKSFDEGWVCDETHKIYRAHTTHYGIFELLIAIDHLL